MLDLGEIELLIETGVGNANDPGMNPVAWLEISRDGGQTWGPQRMAAIGRVGQYGIRVWWQCNGDGRKLAFRVTVSDPVACRIMGLLVEVFDEKGREVNLGASA